MDLKDVRRRCEQRLRSLDPPTPFDVQTFSQRLAAQRGRPIILRPIASHAGPWGLWAATQSADIIFYEEHTSRLHQEHIILHELSHLLCGHTPLPVTEPSGLDALFPDLSAETIQSVLRRAAYSEADECEAEVLASLILESTAQGFEAMPNRDPSAARLLERLHASLGDGVEAEP